MTALPESGRVALVRQRRYLVERATPPGSAGEATLVDLSCLDDDAQGEPLTVLWEHELDARVLDLHLFNAEDTGLGKKSLRPSLGDGYSRYAVPFVSTSISTRQWSLEPHSSTPFNARVRTLSWKPREANAWSICT